MSFTERAIEQINANPQGASAEAFNMLFWVLVALGCCLVLLFLTAEPPDDDPPY